ncbi:M48 family metalloprotease [Sphingorhabdus arenilitoris]|uniref:M48 family metalloprotease n=1 Tax=Sphingorhabdus arenilitoris TaxID=1490041 RepID=A0ABV8RHF9_9SPHN
MNLTGSFSLIAALSLSIFGHPVPAYAQADGGTGAALSPAAFDYQPQDDDERGLWMQMDELEREVKNSQSLIKDPELNAYIRKILCSAVGESCGRVRIYIMRTPYFNASMAPNGMMIVWSGLLLRTKNEAELASVLGHEFSHFDRLHSLQSFRNIRQKTDAMAWMSFVPYVGFIGQIGAIRSIFSFSRDMERQADLVSLDYLADAGYDPRAASDIWRRLRAEMDATAEERKRKSQKDNNGGFFASHPNSGERMEYLEQAAAQKPPKNYVRNEAEYRAALARWWPLLIDDQIKLNDFGATEFLLRQLGESGWTPQLLYARAELYRARGKEGDFTQAAAFYRQSLAADAELAESWRGLGLALIRSGAPEEGKTALHRYLRANPDAFDRGIIEMMAGAGK